MRYETSVCELDLHQEYYKTRIDNGKFEQYGFLLTNYDSSCSLQQQHNFARYNLYRVVIMYVEQQHSTKFIEEYEELAAKSEFNNEVIYIKANEFLVTELMGIYYSNANIVYYFGNFNGFIVFHRTTLMIFGFVVISSCIFLTLGFIVYSVLKKKDNQVVQHFKSMPTKKYKHNGVKCCSLQCCSDKNNTNNNNNIECVNKTNYKEVSCPICLEDYKNGDTLIILNCKHEFHKCCIIKWGKPICPLCKNCSMTQEQLLNCGLGHLVNQEAVVLV